MVRTMSRSQLPPMFRESNLQPPPRGVSPHSEAWQTKSNVGHLSGWGPSFRALGQDGSWPHGRRNVLFFLMRGMMRDDEGCLVMMGWWDGRGKRYLYMSRNFVVWILYSIRSNCWVLCFGDLTFLTHAIAGMELLVCAGTRFGRSKPGVACCTPSSPHPRPTSLWLVLTYVIPKSFCNILIWSMCILFLVCSRVLCCICCLSVQVFCCLWQYRLICVYNLILLWLLP